MPNTVHLVYTLRRREEELIENAVISQGGRVELHRDSDLALSLDSNSVGWQGSRTVLLRTLSFFRARYLSRVLEAKGLRVVNQATAIETCGDKVFTTLALIENGVPTPTAIVGFEVSACLNELEEAGFPVVNKPAIGSWGRTVVRLDDQTAAESVLSLRLAQGGEGTNRVALLQQYIDKPGYDLRVYVVGGRVVGGIRRRSSHWVTNTARGAVAERYDPPREHILLSEQAARAVGGDILAIDLLEDRQGSVWVNEVNHNVEFARSIDRTRVPLPEAIAEFLLGLACRD